MRLSAPASWLASWAGHFSPAQLNPLELNPLRDLLRARSISTACARRSPFKLFVGTTQAHTGSCASFARAN